MKPSFYEYFITSHKNTELKYSIPVIKVNTVLRKSPLPVNQFSLNIGSKLYETKPLIN